MTGGSSFRAVLTSIVIGFLALTPMVSLIGSQCCVPSVDVYPKILHPSGIQEKWVTAYIELPPPEDVYDIDISSIMLNSTIPINPDAGTDIGDYDKDARLDLMVKFDKVQVIKYIYETSINATNPFEGSKEIALTVSWKLNDGTPQEANDTVTVVFFFTTSKNGRYLVPE